MELKFFCTSEDVDELTRLVNERKPLVIPIGKRSIELNAKQVRFEDRLEYERVLDYPSGTNYVMPTKRCISCILDLECSNLKTVEQTTDPQHVDTGWSEWKGDCGIRIADKGCFRLIWNNFVPPRYSGYHPDEFRLVAKIEDGSRRECNLHITPDYRDGWHRKIKDRGILAQLYANELIDIITRAATMPICKYCNRPVDTTKSCCGKKGDASSICHTDCAAKSGDKAWGFNR